MPLQPTWKLTHSNVRKHVDDRSRRLRVSKALSVKTGSITPDNTAKISIIASVEPPQHLNVAAPLRVMEEFLSIDWNPPLEDMLVTKFVNTDRLQSDSAMYRILRGTFGDPFEDMHEDYADLVTKDMVNRIKAEMKEKKQQTAAKKPPVVEPIKAAPNDVQVREKKCYVPGMPKSYVMYPRISSLTYDQQALCLRVMLRFSGSQKPEIGAVDKTELQTYMSLMPIISKEQEEFFEFAKQCWDSSKLEIREEDYINEKWKAKIKLLDSLPRYYTETGNVPFVSPKQIGLNFHSTCLEMGTLPKVILPALTKRFILTANTTKINQRFFAENLTGESQKRVIYKTPVSQDPNCDKLAKDHEVDVVISSGGLNCLAVNMDPQNTISWLLPIVVKRVNEKNVVFIDKPLPPTGRTVMQKNTWFCKYSLKSFTIHPHHIGAFKLDEEDTEKLHERRLYRHWDSSESIDGATAQEEPGEAMEIGGANVTDSPGDDKGGERKDEFVRPRAEHNLFYRLFSVGSCGDPQNELMKNKVEKAYKLLVRTKSDGVMKLVSDEQQMMMVAPKLEHQLALGAEAVTAEEAAKQWMSLTFRPDTCLARVRIDAMTLEVIQVEKRSPGAINNEINRLYNLKTESALALLYNVAETLTAANPGRYLMRHTIRNGAFATIYKEVNGPGKNILDLQAVYCEDEFRTLPNPAWPILDKCVVTPAHKLCNRMPALFRPRGTKQQHGGQMNKGGKKTNNKKKSKANVVRKSARTKGSPAPE